MCGKRMSKWPMKSVSVVFPPNAASCATLPWPPDLFGTAPQALARHPGPHGLGPCSGTAGGAHQQGPQTAWRSGWWCGQAGRHWPAGGPGGSGRRTRVGRRGASGSADTQTPQVDLAKGSAWQWWRLGSWAGEACRGNHQRLCHNPLCILSSVCFFLPLPPTSLLLSLSFKDREEWTALRIHQLGEFVEISVFRFLCLVIGSLCGWKRIGMLKIPKRLN